MKKRFDRLLLCALIVCTLAIPAGLADGENTIDPVLETQLPVTQAPDTPEPATPVPETPEPATPVPVTEEPTSEPTEEPTNEPTQEPTSEPTEEPTSEPAQAPSSEPTQEPSSDPTQESTSEPTQEPTEESTQQPSSEPTQAPIIEPTLEPTAEPSLEPSLSPAVSPEPSATPLPLPGSNDGLVNITPGSPAAQENGVWRIQLSSPDSLISFVWTVSPEVSSHLIYVQSAHGEMCFITETSDMRIDLSPADYANGQHTLYVGAVLSDGNITWGSITFELEGQQPGPPGGRFPGGFSGGSPSGGRSGGSVSMGELSQEEQGFKVTPGKALTSKHSSGTKNATAYTHSEIVYSDEAVAALLLSSTQTEITLDNGAFFFVSEEGGKLQLIPETEGDKWKLNALAMNTLVESGIDCVVFHVGSTAYSLPAKMEFSGSVYASLRAKGYVSKDMGISVDELGVQISVDGCSYSINDANELIPCEE